MLDDFDPRDGFQYFFIRHWCQQDDGRDSRDVFR
jgi:hypothetical protein